MLVCELRNELYSVYFCVWLLFINIRSMRCILMAAAFSFKWNPTHLWARGQGGTNMEAQLCAQELAVSQVTWDERPQKGMGGKTSWCLPPRVWATCVRTEEETMCLCFCKLPFPLPVVRKRYFVFLLVTAVVSSPEFPKQSCSKRWTTKMNEQRCKKEWRLSRVGGKRMRERVVNGCSVSI